MGKSDILDDLGMSCGVTLERHKDRNSARRVELAKKAASAVCEYFHEHFFDEKKERKCRQRLPQQLRREFSSSSSSSLNPYPTSFIASSSTPNKSKVILEIRVAVASDGGIGLMGMGSAKLALTWCLYAVDPKKH